MTYVTSKSFILAPAVVGFPVHVFPILDFGEFGNYKTELVSRIYSGAKLADCQRGPILGDLEPDLPSISSVTCVEESSKDKIQRQDTEGKRQETEGRRPKSEDIRPRQKSNE